MCLTKNQSSLLSSYQPGYSQSRHSNGSDSVHCSSSQKTLSIQEPQVGHYQNTESEVRGSQRSVWYWTSSSKNVGHRWAQLDVLLSMPIHEALRLGQLGKKSVHLYNPPNLSVRLDSHSLYSFHNTLSALIEPIDTCTAARPFPLQSTALDDHSHGEGQATEPQMGSVDHTCLCSQPFLWWVSLFLYLMSKTKYISGPLFSPKWVLRERVRYMAFPKTRERCRNRR